MGLLRGFGRAVQAAAKGAIDGTAYLWRGAPLATGLRHTPCGGHLRSCRVQLADALVIRNAAATLQFSLSMSG